MTLDPFHPEPDMPLFDAQSQGVAPLSQGVGGLSQGDTIQARFEKFDAARPEVYRMFCLLVRQLLAAGRKRYSADAVLHRIRWWYAVNPKREPDGFKINDHFSSRYARKWQAGHLEFADFFETRTLRARGER